MPARKINNKQLTNIKPIVNHGKKVLLPLLLPRPARAARQVYAKL